MKLLFENWRKYLNEINPAAQRMIDDIAKNKGIEPRQARDPKQIAIELGYKSSTEPVLDKNQIEYIITDKFSFNSGQSSQHRWGRGQPIIDYDIDKVPEERIYTAEIPPSDRRKYWIDIESSKGEDLESFLERVQDVFSRGVTHETSI